MRTWPVILFLMMDLCGLAQQSDPARPYTKITRAEYIERYAPFAVKEMHISGVPASITLAQGILESGDGNSLLAQQANNHFGIKCHGVWDGKKFYLDDDAKNECFRVYESVFDSYRDHSEFLRSRDRYAFLFELKPTDYKSWAHGLKKAGYATNPKYPHLLIKIIEENDLARFDRMRTAPTYSGSDNQREKVKHHGTKANSSKPAEAIVSTQSRQIYMRNNIRYIRIQPGDTYRSLERTLQIREWQILKYNDKPKGAPLEPGELIYLQPKRNKNAEHDYHFVVKGETLRWISQEYGVKLKALYKYNELNVGEEPAPGEKIWLRKRRRRDY